jgi:CRISPR-associated protein Cas5d
MQGKTHCLEVWGSLACFTRPELKVERFSYPIITPSAVRGIFDAIYWKKSYDFFWQVEKIEVLASPRYIALRRNEVKDKAPSEKVILAWKQGKRDIEPIWADGDRESLGTDQKGRTQRQTMALKEVRYRLLAHISCRKGDGELKSMDEQFMRRASHGKCFYQPFLGCREFPAYFSYVEDLGGHPGPVPWTNDLGWMLYDVFDLGLENDPFARPKISMFRAKVVNGVLDVPEYHDPRVRKSVEVGND